MGSEETETVKISNLTITIACNNSPKKVIISLELVASVNATAEHHDGETVKTS